MLFRTRRPASIAPLLGLFLLVAGAGCSTAGSDDAESGTDAFTQAEAVEARGELTKILEKPGVLGEVGSEVAAIEGKHKWHVFAMAKGKSGATADDLSQTVNVLVAVAEDGPIVYYDAATGALAAAAADDDKLRAACRDVESGALVDVDGVTAHASDVATAAYHLGSGVQPQAGAKELIAAALRVILTALRNASAKTAESAAVEHAAPILLKKVVTTEIATPAATLAKDAVAAANTAVSALATHEDAVVKVAAQGTTIVGEKVTLWGLRKEAVDALSKALKPGGTIARGRAAGTDLLRKLPGSKNLCISCSADDVARVAQADGGAAATWIAEAPSAAGAKAMSASGNNRVVGIASARFLEEDLGVQYTREGFAASTDAIIQQETHNPERSLLPAVDQLVMGLRKEAGNPVSHPYNWDKLQTIVDDILSNVGAAGKRHRITIVNRDGVSATEIERMLGVAVREFNRLNGTAFRGTEFSLRIL